jgi:hypothetical protein
MLTLNQTTEILKNFATKHKAVNSFYFGDLPERDDAAPIRYPNIQAVLQGSDITNNVVSRRFTIVVSDLVNTDESNETHVLSDCELICYDLLYYLEEIERESNIGLQVVKNGTLTDFTERFDDDVSGWFFDVTISNHIEGFSCDLPIANGNIFDETNYIYVGGQIIENNFEVQIKDQNGNVLQTFYTSGEYTVEVLTRVRDTITANTATIIDPIV